MKLLILGGTIFLGRHLVDAALARGHDVTLFNRGKSGPSLFPDVPTLHGDRKTDEGLAALDDAGPFDAVIDTCGYVPRAVKLSAQKLAGKVSTYCFISTVSVYKSWPGEPCDETGTLVTIEDETVEEVTGETYGALKVLCEKEAEAAFPGKNLIIRPGLIVGPSDPTDRFAYWPNRVAQGGEILAPGNPETPVQFIDVRDLAEWNIRLLEEGQTGVFNADGQQTSFGTLLAACGAESVTYVSEKFLEEQSVAPWSQLPLWIPGMAENPGGGATNVERAIAAGLTYRPLKETTEGTLAWLLARPAEGTWKSTLTREREAEVLAAWHAA